MNTDNATRRNPSNSESCAREAAWRPRSTRGALHCGLVALCAVPVQLLWPIGEAHAQITITVNGTSTLDETDGLQGLASADADNDVAVGTLPDFFYDRLFEPLELGLSTTFPLRVGVAESPAELIDVEVDGPLISLGLTDASGNSFDGTQSAGADIKTLDGLGIFLWSDSDNRIVLGRRPGGGPVVFAVYMDSSPDPDDDSTDVKLWTVTFEPLLHPNATLPDGPDDAVDIFQNVYVTATSSLTFDFDDLPSGQNLFGIVGESATDPAIVVIGAAPVLNADGTYANTSDTINTSKGGGPTTIGIDNQMFDPGDGAFFTYVQDPDARYLAGAPGGLTQNEADDADNILYTGGLLAVGSAFFRVSQIQGGELPTARISAFDLDDDYQGRDFATNLGAAGGTGVDITTVRVFAADGTTLLEAETDGGLPSPDHPDIDIVFSTVDGTTVATVSGLNAGYVVEWDTSGDHEQVLVEGVAGKFDIGLFGVNEGATESESLANHVFVEDDGPKIGPIESSLVDFLVGATVTKPLGGLVGTDIPGVYDITYFTPSISVNDVPVIGAKSGTTVNYFEDKGGTPGVFDDAVDQLYYSLALETIGEIVNYVFTVHFAPAAPDLTFDFDDLPSGQNLFGTVGTPETALVMIGSEPVLNANGTYTPDSDTINTSKGGGPTTIGVNNQMFDPGEGAYFTYVKNPVTNFLAGAPGGLTQNEADDADNILYTGGLLSVDGAFFVISQIQGGDLANVHLSAFDLDDDYQGRDFATNLGAAGGTEVDIIRVRVYDAGGTIVLEEETAQGVVLEDHPDIDIEFDPSGAAIVALASGLDAGYKVEWETDGNHNQVLVEGDAGKFDIGAFGVSEAQVTKDQRLEFTVQLKDKDLDPATASFTVDIDGDHDGVYTEP